MTIVVVFFTVDRQVYQIRPELNPSYDFLVVNPAISVRRKTTNTNTQTLAQILKSIYK